MKSDEQENFSIYALLAPCIVFQKYYRFTRKYICTTFKTASIDSRRTVTKNGFLGEGSTICGSFTFALGLCLTWKNLRYKAEFFQSAGK